MDSIRSIEPPGKWKIIVVDSKSTLILNASCKMYDILEENVSLYEEDILILMFKYSGHT
jgi:syntaxin-binding protein 1